MGDSNLRSTGARLARVPADLPARQPRPALGHPAPDRVAALHPVQLSVILPCLNEADTIATCVRNALEGIRNAGVSGEVVVADNGSTDGSPVLARAAGARVCAAHERGYGAALMAGIAASSGTFIIMADADESYDLTDIPRFVELLRAGLRARAGLPAARRRRGHCGRCNALDAPAPRKSRPFVDCTAVVQDQGHRYLLRDAGVPP